MSFYENNKNTIKKIIIGILFLGIFATAGPKVAQQFLDQTNTTPIENTVSE